MERHCYLHFKSTLNCRFTGPDLSQNEIGKEDLCTAKKKKKINKMFIELVHFYLEDDLLYLNKIGLNLSYEEIFLKP